MAESIRGDVYTLELAEEHIGNLNGNVDRLTELHPLADSQVPNTPGAGNGSQLYSLAGVAQGMTDQGVAGALAVTSTDTGTTTITGTSAAALSAVWTIPANDANLGTCYRLTAFGNGTWGSTQQALAFGIGFPGNTEFGTHQAVGAPNFQVSATFRWMAILTIMLVGTPGASASWNGQMMLNITQTANSINTVQNPPSAGTNSIGAAQGPSSNVTQDSTISNAFQMIAWWGSTTGSPTITCHGTLFERLGA